MDFEVRERDGKSQLIAVPSHENGIFVVDIPDNGRYAVDEVELPSVPEGNAIDIVNGDTEMSLRYVEATGDQQHTTFRFLGDIGRISIGVPNSRNSVSHRIGEVEEFTPAGCSR